jgi:hypothetical protein
MQNALIKAAILFAIYKFAPSSEIKTGAVAIAAGLAAGYIPYLNGKDLKGAAV